MITQYSGLSSVDATRRLADVGPNQLPTPGQLRWPEALRRQLVDPVMGVLLVAAALTIAIRDWSDASVVGMVILLDATLGAVQDLRAARAVAALADLTAPHATVVRDGVRRDIPAIEVVPGDRVELVAGDIVPADVRLSEARSLQLDESMLTGESMPVDRAAGESVYAGTVVRRGRGDGVVSRTGSGTEIGRIAADLQSTTRVLTPMQRQLAGLGRHLAILVGVVAVIVVTMNIVGGHGVEYSVTIGLSLAVAAIPESLPAVVTLALAFAARRMVAVGVVARRLAAVESLRSVTVLAADKTGTLTLGRMSIQEVWTPSSTLGERMLALEAGVLCNDATEDGSGERDDPVERAIVDAARDAGILVSAVRRDNPRIAEEPFDAAVARMVTTHRAGGAVMQVVKGSPEAVERFGATSADAHAVAERLARAGLRVLAVATSDGSRWTLRGQFGLSDPPRPEARSVVSAFRRAGVRPMMITGDHPSTAAGVAAVVGIAPGDVHARVRPESKRAVVEDLQRRGEVVAMTGDGVNDGPALRRADVGVAMGRRGTEVAKQAADLVLVNDDLSALVDAIAEGRRAYDNVRRFLNYALAGGLAEVLVMVLGPVFGLALPLQPGQILWVNLLTHGLPGVAMGSEPAEGDVLSRAPRCAGSPLVDRPTALRVAVFAVLITGACVTTALWAKSMGGAWQSELFVTLTMCQLALALVLRPRWRRRDANWMLLVAVAGNAALVVAAVAWSPLQDLLGTEALGTAGTLRVLVSVAGFTAAAWGEQTLERTLRRGTGRP